MWDIAVLLYLWDAIIENEQRKNASKRLHIAFTVMFLEKHRVNLWIIVGMIPGTKCFIHRIHIILFIYLFFSLFLLDSIPVPSSFFFSAFNPFLFVWYCISNHCRQWAFVLFSKKKSKLFSRLYTHYHIHGNSKNSNIQSKLFDESIW